MNRTEARYAEVLEARQRAGEIAWYLYEAIALRLAEHKCFYHPDFTVMLTDGTLEIHEVKGEYVREDGWLKLKIAASKFPFVFRKCTWTKNAGWKIEVIGNQIPAKPIILPGTAIVHVASRAERFRGGAIPEGFAVVNGELVSRAAALALLQK